MEGRTYISVQSGLKLFLANMKKSSVVLILFAHILLPTADVVSDLILIERLVAANHMEWATLSCFPIILATAFHLMAWGFEEGKNEVLIVGP